MRPMRIALEGYGSFREPTVIDLADANAACIVGANRAGKTTLIESIGWALYGKARGSSADSVVSYSASRCRVVLDCEIGHVIYRVERQRDRMKAGSSALFLQIIDWKGSDSDEPVLTKPIGGDRIAETQAMIDELLGMDFATWQSTSFIGQGRADAFTSMRPAERKELLAEVLELGVYEGLADRARLEERNERALCEASRQEAERANEQAVDLDVSVFELVGLQAKAQETSALLEQSEGDATATRAAMEHLQERLRAVATRPVLLRQLAELQVDMTASLPDLSGAIKETEGHLASAEEALDALRDRMIGEERTAAELKAQAVAARSRQEALAHADAECPVCKRPLGRYERERVLAEAQAEEDALEGPQADASARALAAGRAVRECGDAIQKEARPALDALRRKAAEIDQRAARRAEAVKKSGEVRAQLLALPQGEADDLERQLHVERDRLADLDRNIRDLQTSQQHLSREIGLAEAKVSQHGALVEQAAAAALKASSHEEVRHLAELAARACGRDGIPARLIEAAIPEIEDRANEVLAHLMGELTVTLESTRATKTAGIRETLDIVVIAAGEERPLEELSGSERASVDIALRLGLSMMLAARAGSPMDLLVIDEGFTAFDTEHRQAVPGILRRLADIFPMVLLVTHEQLFADAFDTRILVARGEDGSSTVRIEGTRAAA